MATPLEAKKVLALLSSEESPAAVAARLGVSPEAVDEARYLLEEIRTAAADAILAMPPALAPALLRAAALAGREELLAEAALSPRREIQKEARRLAHHLRQQGKEIELPRPETEPAPTPAAPTEPDLPVLLSPIDSEGHRALLWTRPITGRGVEIARLVIDEERVLDFDVWESSRKKLRELVKELTEGRARMRVLPRAEVQRALDRVRHAMETSGGAPAGFATWALAALGAVPPQRPEPIEPLDGGKAPEDPREREALARASDSLFGEPEVGSWIPEENFLRTLALRIDEARTSPLYLPGPEGEVQRREAIWAAVDREADRYFNATRRTLFADRLLEAARLMEVDGRTESARRAAAASARLREGAPLQEIGFGLEFVRRLVRNHPAFRESDTSRLVTPP